MNDMNNIMTGMEPNAGIRSMQQYTEATFHGLARTMERTGKDELHSINLIQKAWNKGKATNEYNQLWNLMPKMNGNRTVSEQRLNTEHRVYKGNLFVFSKDGKLITMFPLPDNYYHKLQFRGKERLRKAKRYDRMNSMVS